MAADPQLCPLKRSLAFGGCCPLAAFVSSVTQGRPSVEWTDVSSSAAALSLLLSRKWFRSPSQLTAPDSPGSQAKCGLGLGLRTGELDRHSSVLKRHFYSYPPTLAVPVTLKEHAGVPVILWVKSSSGPFLPVQVMLLLRVKSILYPLCVWCHGQGEGQRQGHRESPSFLGGQQERAWSHLRS